MGVLKVIEVDVLAVTSVCLSLERETVFNSVNPDSDKLCNFFTHALIPNSGLKHIGSLAICENFY